MAAVPVPTQAQGTTSMPAELQAANKLRSAVETLYRGSTARNGKFTFQDLSCEGSGDDFTCTQASSGLKAVCVSGSINIPGADTGGLAPTRNDYVECSIRNAANKVIETGETGKTKSTFMLVLTTSAGGGVADATSRETIDAETGKTTVEASATSVLPSVLGGIASTIFGAVMKPIVMFILALASFILMIAGVFFNWVVIRTVFQFGEYFGTSDGMLMAWGVMRDIANIGLLFGFIFMGVLLILNVDGGGHGHGHGGGISAKRAIPRLIIFAVLLNFSLFASQAIIDVSNAFASTFTTLAGEVCDDAAKAAECANDGIAGQVLQMAGIGTLFEEGLLDNLDAGLIVLTGLSIFVLITALVLIAAGIMLVARVVVLSLLMVTSPIGFAGMVIPGLHGLASKWWHALISQSFFAPVLLLLIFISLKLAESLNPGGAPLIEAFAGEATGIAGNLHVIVVFAIVIGFMIASLIAASKMGAMGAKFATQTAAGLTVGSVAWAGRRSIGVVSSKTAERIRKSSMGSTEGGRFLAGIVDYGAKANYDLRSTKAASLAGGLDLGKAQKGGYEGIVHHATEQREKYAKSLQQTDADKAAEKALNARKERLTEDKKRSSSELESKKKELQARVAPQEAANKVAAQARADERKIQEAKFAAALSANGGKSDSEAVKREEEALRTLTETHRKAAAAEEAKIAEMRTEIESAESVHKIRTEAIDSEIKGIDKQIKGEAKDGHVISTGVSSNAASYRYVQDLHKKRAVNVVSAGGRASHHAAESIVKNANKSKIEKALDGIKEATEKKDDHGDEHGTPAGESHGGAASGEGNHGGSHGPAPTH